MDEMADRYNLTQARFLGGQNPLEMYCAGVYKT